VTTTTDIWSGAPPDTGSTPPNGPPDRRWVEVLDGLAADWVHPVDLVRWIALGIGALLVAATSDPDGAAALATAAVLAVHAVWRSANPLPVATAPTADAGLAVVDAALVGAAVGLSGGADGPYAMSLLVAVGAAALGWGVRCGLLAGGAGVAGAAVAASLLGAGDVLPSLAAVSGIAAAVAVPATAHASVVRADRDRLRRRSELAELRDATLVLSDLADLARNLPTNLDLDEVQEAIREQLLDRFDADRLVIVTLDEGRWHPLVAHDDDLPIGCPLDQLPEPLARASVATIPVRVDDLRSFGARSGSGLYGRLVVDGSDHGVIGVERSVLRPFTTRDAELFDGVTDVVALALENARTFGLLRSSAAAEERGRIARDLHDRLGQWLTYIGIELERIHDRFEEPDPELVRLQDDVRSAIAELRDALVELRTTVRAERPLAVVLPEVVERFRERTGLSTHLTVPDDPTRRLGGVVENELLRIIQETLTNIDKHADAKTVHINWSVDDGRGLLTIEDDGRGFDPDRGIRSTAYGLVGMRERAAAVGAILEIASERGTGTVITVLVGTNKETTS
jgi:signal transduction histidine kinase